MKLTILKAWSVVACASIKLSIVVILIVSRERALSFVDVIYVVLIICVALREPVFESFPPCTSSNRIMYFSIWAARKL
jgi:hypothetical protein